MMSVFGAAATETSPGAVCNLLALSRPTRALWARSISNQCIKLDVDKIQGVRFGNPAFPVDIALSNIKPF